MTAITVGNAAIDRASRAPANYTHIDKVNPANGTGTIDTVAVYIYTAVSSAKVGIFYVVSANNLTCRSYANLGALSVGLNTITGLSLAVQTGDYIGIYIAGGEMDRADSGGANWVKSGDNIPCTNLDFGTPGTRLYSLSGSGTTPATSSIKSICGVALASVKKADGLVIGSVKRISGVANG